MPDLTVADSSPIISFARAKKLHLINKYELIATGFRTTPELIKETLQKAEE